MRTFGLVMAAAVLCGAACTHKEDLGRFPDGGPGPDGRPNSTGGRGGTSPGTGGGLTATGGALGTGGAAGGQSGNASSGGNSSGGTMGTGGTGSGGSGSGGVVGTGGRTNGTGGMGTGGTATGGTFAGTGGVGTGGTATGGTVAGTGGLGTGGVGTGGTGTGGMGTGGSPGTGGCTIAGRALLPNVTNHAGTTVTIVGAGITSTTASDGSYSITGVPGGTYRVDFRNGAYEETLPTVLCTSGPALFVNHQQQVFTIPAVNLIRGHRLRTSEVYNGRLPYLSTGDVGFVAWGPPESVTIAAINGATGALTMLADRTFDRPGVLLTKDESRVLIVYGGNGSSWSVHSAPVAGGPGIALGMTSVPPSPWRMVLSPDGSRLLLNQPGPDSPARLVPVAGGTSTALGALGNLPYDRCRFTPDGSGVFCGNSRAFIAPANGGPLIWYAGGSGQPGIGDLSPDGATVAFTESVFNPTTDTVTLTLYASPAAGGSARSLGPAGTGPVAFSPDGRIVYQTAQGTVDWISIDGATHGTIMPATSVSSISFGAGQDRFIVNADGKLSVASMAGATPIMIAPSTWQGTFTPDRSRFLAWGPSGGLVAASLLASTSAVVTLGMTGGEPTVSPDSQWVAFATVDEIRLSRTDGTMNRAIGSGNFIAGPQFSRDSRLLAFNVNESVWVMSTSDAAATPVTLQGRVQGWAGANHFVFSHEDTGMPSQYTTGPYLSQAP